MVHCQCDPCFSFHVLQKKPGLPLAPSRKEVGSEQGTGKNTAQLAGDKSIHPGREKTAVPRQFSARGRAVTAAKSSPQMGVRPPATCHTAVAVAAVPPRVTTAPVDSRCKVHCTAVCRCTTTCLTQCNNYNVYTFYSLYLSH